MANFFGKTWWGAQWLNSLAHIDNSNRLPRGSAYAKKGAVKSLEIHGNAISARVQGTRVSPYKVAITVPSFSEKEVKALVEGLAEKPAIISKLLNRELDPEALQIAERRGLRVFPRRWSDFGMECSCPDVAVPCKHLAAVVYKLSAEIDNNPFLIFRLHSVDLPKELAKVDVHVSTGQAEVPSFAEALGLPEAQPAAKQKPPAAPPVADEAALRSVNFSTLTPIADALVQLLPDAPVFYQQAGNFREKYALLLRKACKNALRILASKASLGDFFSLLPALQRAAPGGGVAESIITHRTKIQLSVSDESKPTVLLNGRQAGISLAEFIPVLWAIPAARLHDYQPSVAALHTLLLYSVNLIANGAVTPQIVRLGSKQYHIRWLPAMLSSDVRSLTEKLEPLLPQTLLLWNEKEALDKGKATGVSSVFLSALLHRLAEERSGSDIFLELFFGGADHAFGAPGEEALPGGIGAWLQRYYIAQGRYRPGIMVDELENGDFCASINVRDTANPISKPMLLSDILTIKKYDKIRFEALQSLTLLSSFIPGLDRCINARGKSEIIMSNAEFAPFLMQTIPVIHLLNISVLLPKSLREILRPRASVQIRQKNKDNTGFMRLESLLDFEWRVALGDTVMSEAEFKAILKNSAGLIKYKARYIYVSSDDLSKLHRHFSSDKMLLPCEMLRTALSSDYYGAKVSLTGEVKALVKKLVGTAEVPLPKALTAQLRPYQQRGFSWMYRNAQAGFGSLIADDMGLGKTLQVLTLLLKLKEDGALKKEKALVIAPTGLLANWQAEVEKFAPSLAVKLYHGAKRELEAGGDYDALLTSYGVARSDAHALKKKKWRAVVIDEAQNIKNYETAQSKAIKSIPAATFIAMSGTPVENRLSELWSIMDFCNRSFLGALSEFREAFANPIQNRHDVAATEKLKKVTAPFMIRRLKSDKSIISDLPDKIEIDSFTYLVKAQAGLYKKTLHEAMKSIEAIEETDSQSLFVRQGLVLQMILALKQICNHPTQFLKNNVLDASLSGKVDLLLDKLESIVEANEKALIFTQFTEMGRLLQHFITERFGDKPLFYHGGCTLKQRKAAVEAFQSNRTDKLLILSLKAAGTGLNLTAASHVIHYDLWWNPAVEAQATDRAYRIGQKSNVMVHRFITKGTFEERINEMIQRKKDLANLTISTGESWIGNLSNKELRGIFELNRT
ncbi:MAG: DEAD/DEAH box helicase [Prevotellaceae bacterium]|jgi:uncharacterized Zn finger protein/superfamily II DNA or RNA helicase|nr:DEAD/DEAH box helicase [Prevotellaceae bacterium]